MSARTNARLCKLLMLVCPATLLANYLLYAYPSSLWSVECCLKAVNLFNDFVQCIFNVLVIMTLCRNTF